jgi:hypothetical protein
MTKTQTICMALLLVLASCAATAEQPDVWHPAQQAPDAQTTQTASPPKGQQPAVEPGQPQAAQPGQQPAAQPSQQPAAPGAASGNAAGDTNDPRVDQPVQPLDPVVPAEHTGQAGDVQQALVITPDRTPLNTPQELTLGGGWEMGRSYFQPSVRVNQIVSSSSDSSSSRTVPITMLSGTAMLTQNWSRSHLMLNYGAGGTLFPTEWDATSSFQQFGASLGFGLGRWGVSITDQGNYLPESAFGYYGLGLSGYGYGSTSGLGVGYQPNQSILTTSAARLSNTAATTMSYQVSPRSSIHFSGSFAILRFQSGGLTNTTDGTYSVGYDRSFGVNTLGISYLGSLYYYGGSDRSIQSNGASLAYGRRVTGRLALQIAGGPQVRLLDDPAVGSDSQVTWNIRGGLVYQLGRLNISTSLSRDTGAGAGVFGGVETFIWETAVSRSLGRVWAGSANFGIARNTALAVEKSPERIVNSQYVGLQLSRPFNRETSVYFSYYFQHQTSNTLLCVGCGESFNRHVGAVGFEWHSKPFALGTL